MKHLQSILRLFPIVALSVVLTGCLFKPKSDPSRFFVLGTGQQATATGSVECEKRVIVGPVTLAGHLDNPKIARRSGENEIVYYGWTFWAEPLPRALPRELLRSLEKAIPDACVFGYRQGTPDDKSIQVEVSFGQFEMTDNGEVVVSATWSITSPEQETRKKNSVRISRPYETGGDEIASGVRALTVALDDLAAKLAEDLR